MSEHYLGQHMRLYGLHCVAYKHPLSTHDDVFNGATCLNFDLHLNLHLFGMYAVSSQISCAGPNSTWPEQRIIFCGPRGGPPPEKSRWLKVSLEILVRTPLRSDWTPWVQLLLNGGSYEHLLYTLMTKTGSLTELSGSELEIIKFVP